MGIVEHIRTNLGEIRNLLLSLEDIHFTFRFNCLSGATIGQHVRHILEFYQCLFETGNVICYDDRKRDLHLETNQAFALKVIDDILSELKSIGKDRSILLRSNFSAETYDNVYLSTSLYREMAHALEHSIHHQALIKVVMTQLCLEDGLSDNFGLAPATLRYQNS
jgi:hypothetical protein